MNTKSFDWKHFLKIVDFFFICSVMLNILSFNKVC